MTKTVLLTGATDGIGFETARMLVAGGHTVLLHGRNPAKLERAAAELEMSTGAGVLETYVADLSDLSAAAGLARSVASRHDRIDALINNAGVYGASSPILPSGLDVRFVVNTLAPYVLTRCLRSNLRPSSRVVNVSSAAQAPVELDALEGRKQLGDGDAYAQSKLAIAMWTRHLAAKWGADGPVLVAVNPASMLGSKMVKDAYGVDGGDLRIGADILARAALSEEFAGASGKYYDNDRRAFADPHLDAMDAAKVARVVATLDTLVSDFV